MKRLLLIALLLPLSWSFAEEKKAPAAKSAPGGGEKGSQGSAAALQTFQARMAEIDKELGSQADAMKSQSDLPKFLAATATQLKSVKTAGLPADLKTAFEALREAAVKT